MDNIETRIRELNHQLDLLETNPKLRKFERHDEYYAHSSVHGGNMLKEHALMVCSQVDEDTPEYKTLALPLIKRIEAFFAHPNIELDFTDEVRMLRARRLIEQGRYAQADKVYTNIIYGPLYASAFEQRNRYFLNAGKNHLHLMKKMTHPKHIKQQLLFALETLQYVHEYPHGDDITLYQKAPAIFAQNYYNEAKVQVSKICAKILPNYLEGLSQSEILLIYKAVLPYKYTLSHEVPELSSSQHFNNRVERWSAMSSWRALMIVLQKRFISLSFEQHEFHLPQTEILSDAHALMDEPTSLFEQFSHIVGKTHLEKNFSAALFGNKIAVQNLRKFVR